MRLFCVVPFVLLAFTTHAASIDGKAITVADGDTITILDADNNQHRIRINGIDAPEKGQPFGDRSRQNLRYMVSGKEVMADCHKIDRYGRQVCKVWARPANCPWCNKSVDVGQAQIVAGLAWWYREYAKEQSAEDRGRYESTEKEAQVQKIGLWQQSNPMPPWEWRKEKRAR